MPTPGLARARDTILPIYGSDLWTPRSHRDLVGWWSGLQGLVAGAGSATFTTWRDLGPNGIDLAAIGGANASYDLPPLLGYRPGVLFPGAPAAATAFSAPASVARAGSLLTPSDGNTVVIVAAPIATSGIPFHHGSGDGSESMRIQFVGDTSLYMDPQGGSSYWQTGGGVYALNTAYVVSATAYNNGAGWRFRKNGTGLGIAAGSGSGAPDSNAGYPFTIGGFGASTAVNWRGWIAEIVYYRRALPLDEVQQIERRFGEFYGIAVA